MSKGYPFKSYCDICGVEWVDDYEAQNLTWYGFTGYYNADTGEGHNDLIVRHEDITRCLINLSKMLGVYQTGNGQAKINKVTVVKQSPKDLYFKEIERHMGKKVYLVNLDAVVTLDEKVFIHRDDYWRGNYTKDGRTNRPTINPDTLVREVHEDE